MKHLLITAVIGIGTMVSAQTFTNYTTTEGLLSNNVLCLDVAASDVLWFGTQNGVSVFDGTNWSSHTVALSGIIDDNIQAICVKSNGDVWIGTDFGASFYDGNTWTNYTTSDGLGNNQIKCIEEDAQGNVWFGTNSGASKFDGNAWTNLGTSDGIPFGGVTAITLDTNGDVWLGSGLNGISIYDGTNINVINSSTNGLTDDRIRGLVLDNQDNRWVGTSEGITVLDASNNFVGNHTQIYTLPAPDTLNPIEDIELDNNGNIWAGVYVDYLVTEGGICAYDGNSWTEYHTSDGLIGPVVRALKIDSQNNVWVATSTGVSKLSDHNVGVEDHDEIAFSVYPNPASSDIKVSWKSGNVEQISLYGSDSRIVHESKPEAGTTEVKISLGSLPAGVYFVKLNEKTERVIKL